MNEKIKNYITENSDLMYKTLKELALIAAPSHFEHDRAEYCKKWLGKYGAKGVYIDEAINVIFPINCEGSDKITVFAAHTDTVFPDREPMPYFDDGEKIFCPAISDDTAGVVVLMLTAKFYIENNIAPKNGIMFVFNSCEEGLGNLKGTRQLFKDYNGRVESFVTLDSQLYWVADRAVGSHRYEVEVVTEGGHSFSAFGNRNAVAELSKIVTEIYNIKVPQKEGCKATYNVGIIEGGTSVNTIPQSAKMLCEYRSDDKECLDFLKGEFEKIFAAAAERTELRVKLVGDRPCADIEQEKIDNLKAKVVPIIEETIGKSVTFRSSSTDCNIPLSLGVAAICIGSNIHANIHTREEWMDKESMKPGLSMVIKTSMSVSGV